GDESGRRLRCRPLEARGCQALREAHLHRRPHPAPPGDGCDRGLALHGQRSPDPGLQSDAARKHQEVSDGRAHRHARTRRRRATSEAPDTTKQATENTVAARRKDLGHGRTGRASRAILEGLTVEYYGERTPLNQLATLPAPEASLLVVQPYDKS